MDAEFTCRACRRGRCDQCEGGGCACEKCGERPLFAAGGIIPSSLAGSEAHPPPFLSPRCLYG
jgi:hypothetical protein